MSRLPRLDQRGVALPLALFALVIIAALLAGAFYMGRLEQHSGDNAMARAQAGEAAEAGLAATTAAWNPAYNTMTSGTEVTLGTVTVGGTNTYTTAVRRLNAATYLVRSEGRHLSRTGAVITRQQLGRLVRLSVPDIDMNAAVTTRVGISIGGSTEISGNDSVPPQWSGGMCPPAGTTAAGVRDSSGNVNTFGACSGASCITGNPAVQTDPSITTGSFNQFGDISFSQLAAMANKLVSGTVTGVAPTINTGPPVSCRTGDLLNWGDPYVPSGACFSYFPIIYSAGNLRISGGYGQGILLVNGDLEISGGFEFFGPAIVQGSVTSTGTGGHIVGGLMAQNASLATSLISGNSTVTFSRCAITRALLGSASATTLGSRSWSQLF
jgi:Tfp pilus assembly protein PilX